jgi:hypothetical protein
MMTSAALSSRMNARRAWLTVPRAWQVWFSRGYNQTAFLEYYDIPPEMARRKLEPRYVLVHGRRDNFESIPRRREKRAVLAKPDERLMSFDRLTPAKNSVLYSTVRKGTGRLPSHLGPALPHHLQHRPGLQAHLRMDQRTRQLSRHGRRST